MTVSLRTIKNSDLSVFFEQQLDPEANRLAAFVSDDPSDKSQFDKRWQHILGDDQIVKKAVIVDGEIAGNVMCYPQDGELEVTYWIGKEFWGRGVATEALKLFLQAVDKRPMYARVVIDNHGSVKVLKKCNFTVIDSNKDFANGRGEEVEEYVMRLDNDVAR